MSKTRIFEGSQYILEYDGQDLDVYTQQPLSDENALAPEDSPWVCNVTVGMPYSHEIVSRMRALDGQLIAGYLVEALLTGFGLGMRFGREDGRIVVP